MNSGHNKSPSLRLVVSHTLHGYESHLSYLDLCLLSYLWLPISHVQSAMAESTPTYVSELVNHMKGLTTVMDEETLLDLAVEHVADAAARKLGLKQGKGRESEGLKNPSHRAKAIC